MESMVEVLAFIISLINSEGHGGHTDLIVFGLELMNMALTAGSAGLLHALSSVPSKMY